MLKALFVATLLASTTLACGTGSLAKDAAGTTQTATNLVSPGHTRGPMLHATTPAQVDTEIAQLLTAADTDGHGTIALGCVAYITNGLQTWQQTHLITRASFLAAAGADGGEAKATKACTRS